MEGELTNQPTNMVTIKRHKSDEKHQFYGTRFSVNFRFF